MTKIDNWSLEKIAAQCVFPRLDITQYISDVIHRDSIKELVKLGCGGFCIFNGNTENVSQTISELQMLTDTPLLFCSDFENGLQMRLEDGTSFPHSMALAKSKKFTAEIAQAIALEAKNIGVLWNLAPVADINSNPNNPVINIRSFGEDKNVVVEHTVQYINALQAEGVAATAKHFPGHGDTATDSHTSYPIISKSEQQLAQEELLPFIAAIQAGVKSIMVGHIIVNSSNGLPASLSPIIIKDWLKNKLNFNGIIVSDALDMGTIVAKYSTAKASTLAISAGNDVVLMPMQPFEAIIAIKDWAGKNEANHKQILESVQKIFQLKKELKLIPLYSTISDNIKLFTNHLQLALKAAVGATDCWISEKNIIPLPEGPDFPYAAFAIIQRTDDIQAASRFFTMLADATEENCDYAYIDDSINDEEINNFMEGIVDAKYLIFGIFYKGRGYSERLGNAQKINTIISKLADGRPTIVCFFGDPYIANTINANNKILTYSDSFASLASAIMTMTGRKL